jgi:hypothetical protein
MRELSERAGIELSWPEYVDAYVFDQADSIVSYVDRLRSDLISVKELVERKGAAASRAKLFLADDWLYTMASRIDEDLSSLMQDETIRAQGAAAAKSFGQLKKLRPSLSADLERRAIEEFLAPLQADTGLTIALGESSDPAAKQGLPEKPGVLIE